MHGLPPLAVVLGRKKRPFCLEGKLLGWGLAFWGAVTPYPSSRPRLPFLQIHWRPQAGAPVLAHLSPRELPSSAWLGAACSGGVGGASPCWRLRGAARLTREHRRPRPLPGGHGCGLCVASVAGGAPGRGVEGGYEDRAEEGLGSSPWRPLQLEFATGLPGWGGQRRTIRGGSHRRARVLGVRGQVRAP